MKPWKMSLSWFELSCAVMGPYLVEQLCLLWGPPVVVYPGGVACIVQLLHSTQRQFNKSV